VKRRNEFLKSVSLKHRGLKPSRVLQFCKSLSKISSNLHFFALERIGGLKTREREFRK